MWNFSIKENNVFIEVKVIFRALFRKSLSGLQTQYIKHITKQDGILRQRMKRKPLQKFITLLSIQTRLKRCANDWRSK